MNYRDISRKRKARQAWSGPVEPFYISLAGSELEIREKMARSIMEHCSLCPRRCGVNRLGGERGFCRQGSAAKVAKALPHFGEEPPLSGTKGAGTVFFSGCTLRCIFCQNWQISHREMGEITDADALADIFLELQSKGCHNIELVSPTPHIASFITALRIAGRKGLCLPIVYNTNGYLSAESLSLLDGLVDIYLPDIKYSSPDAAEELSGCRDYVYENRRSLKEMARQCGRLLKTDPCGIAVQGLLIRLLLLPEGLEGAEESLSFVAEELGPDIPVSIMSQYTPLYRALEHRALNSDVSSARRRQVMEYAVGSGIREIWDQHDGSARLFIPDFLQENPFGDMNREAPPTTR